MLPLTLTASLTRPLTPEEDARISLAPVAAGLFVSLTGYSLFDPLIAGAVAVWFIVSTGRELLQSHDELIWPEKIVCGHSDHDDQRTALP